MFAWFTGIGIGHEAVLLKRHTHGLAIDSPYTGISDEDDEDSKELNLWRASLEETGEDKDMDGIMGYASDDSSSYICF